MASARINRGKRREGPGKEGTPPPDENCVENGYDSAGPSDGEQEDISPLEKYRLEDVEFKTTIGNVVSQSVA